MSEGDDKTSPATQEEESREAASSHLPDRAPTADEEEAADRSRREFSDEAGEVAEHERIAAERGAHVKGEGEVT